MGRRWAVARLAARQAHDMDHGIAIVLLAFSALVSAYEPLAVLMQRRRNAYPIYASDFMDEYEPYAVAAIPLNSPMQFFQVLPPTPFRNSGKFRKPAKRPQPHRDLQAYASSNVEPAYEQYAYDHGDHVYSDSVSQPKYKLSPYDDEASSVVVYARPNKNGGYSYRKPSVPTPAPPTPLAQREPIIIRIHKYRVIH